MMNTKTLVAGALLALSAVTSQAAEGFKPVIGMALTGGGKTLLSVEMDDGSTQRMSSGGVIQLWGGFEFRAPDSPLTIQGNVGYHVDGIGASNGDASFSRVPFELLAFWNTDDKFRIGGGLRKATSARFSSSGATDVGDFNMRTNVGFVLQGEYFFSPSASIYLRFVSETYKSNLLNGGEVTGDHGGVGMALRF